MKKQTTAERLHAEAFHGSRSPRSDAYKAGVLYALRSRLEGHRAPAPYALGTAEADAFFSGCQEGHIIARDAEAAS